MGSRRQGPRRPAGARRGGGRSGRPDRLALGGTGRLAARGRAEAPRGGTQWLTQAPGETDRRLSELIAGRHPILEALRANRHLNRLLVAEGVADAAIADALRLAAERNVPVRRVPRERLDELADHHQGLVADAAPFSYSTFESILEQVKEAPTGRPPLILALDALQDPQNFGTLLRTALAVGVDGVILPERRSVGVTAAVGRASAGAIERLRIARVVNLVRALLELKRAGVWIVGLDTRGADVYDQTDLTIPLALVVGSEGSGLGRLVLETCDVLVRLPMSGPVDSLNAAVAGSIVLYEASRQRRARGA